jgi:azurin
MMIATVPTSIDQQGLLAFYLQIGFNAPTLMACGCAHVTQSNAAAKFMAVELNVELVCKSLNCQSWGC